MDLHSIGLHAAETGDIYGMAYTNKYNRLNLWDGLYAEIQPAELCLRDPPNVDYCDRGVSTEDRTRAKKDERYASSNVDVRNVQTV